MSLLTKRDFQRREGLRQSSPPEILMEHRHSYWAHQDYTIIAGRQVVTATSYAQTGPVLRLDPVVLMFAVKIELHLTTTFAGPPDSFSIMLCLGSHCIERETFRASTHALSISDLSGEYGRFFPEFEAVDMGFAVKVSNAASPLSLHGAMLRWVLYEKDTFGDYEKPTSRLLIDKHLADKALIRMRDKEAEQFKYLSGLSM